MSDQSDRRSFEGTSSNGNLQEALDAAVAAARAGVSAEGFTWTLGTVRGEKDGFVPANNVTVSIHVD